MDYIPTPRKAKIWLVPEPGSSDVTAGFMEGKAVIEGPWVHLHMPPYASESYPAHNVVRIEWLERDS